MSDSKNSPVDPSKMIEEAKQTPFYIKVTFWNLVGIFIALLTFFLWLDDQKDIYENKIDALSTEVADLKGLREQVEQLEDPEYLMNILRKNNGIDFTVFKNVANNCDSIRIYRSELTFLYEQNNCR